MFVLFFGYYSLFIVRANFSTTIWKIESHYTKIPTTRLKMSLWTTIDFECPCGWGFKKMLPRGTRKYPLAIILHKKCCALDIKTTDLEIQQNIELKPLYKGSNRMTSHKKKISAKSTIAK